MKQKASHISLKPYLTYSNHRNPLFFFPKIELAWFPCAQVKIVNRQQTYGNIYLYEKKIFLDDVVHILYIFILSLRCIECCFMLAILWTSIPLVCRLIFSMLEHIDAYTINNRRKENAVVHKHQQKSSQIELYVRSFHFYV